MNYSVKPINYWSTTVNY